MNILEIKNLKVHFPSEDGLVRPVDELNLDVKTGETLGLIGESGSGKTVFSLAVPGLLYDNAKIEGEILFKNRNLLSISESELRHIRGGEIGIVFQSSNALNPAFTVGNQLYEAIKEHLNFDKESVVDKALNLLERVNLNPPSKWFKRYPHEFSGGMKQRALIAMGISSDPSLIIADEPTRGLDVTIKRKTTDLLEEVAKDRSMLVITHDLTVAWKLADRVAVMYAGEIVEIAKSGHFFRNPYHPYSEGLLNSHPSQTMEPIPGTSPSLIHLPAGCRFYPRCEYAMDVCKNNHPPMMTIGTRHVRCFLYD